MTICGKINPNAPATQTPKTPFRHFNRIRRIAIGNNRLSTSVNDMLIMEADETIGVLLGQIVFSTILIVCLFEPRASSWYAIFPAGSNTAGTRSARPKALP